MFLYNNYSGATRKCIFFIEALKNSQSVPKSEVEEASQESGTLPFSTNYWGGPSTPVPQHWSDKTRNSRDNEISS